MFFKRKQIIASLILSLFFNFNIFNNFNDNYKITFIGDEIKKAYKGWIRQQNKKLIGSYKYHYGC